LPVHNLKSLEQLGNLLERLSEYRPERRQHITPTIGQTTSRA
jgi:hypothetical protein